MSVTPELKRFYAEEIRAIGALQNEPNTERVLDRARHYRRGGWNSWAMAESATS